MYLYGKGQGYVISRGIVKHLSNRTVRVCAVIGIRVDARIHLIRNIVGVVADISRTCRSATVVQVGVEAWVKLISSVCAMRAIVGRGI